MMIESPNRIEPARLEDVPEAIADVTAELSAASVNGYEKTLRIGLVA